MLEKDYVDKKGIPRRALVETETSPPDKGILTSFYMDDVLRERGCSADFIKTLYNEMVTRGLITPADILEPQAAELLRAALLATIRLDVQTLQGIAKEQFNNGRTNHRA